MKYQLSLINNPNGTFSFVGSVPIELAYVGERGQVLTQNDSAWVKDQLMLPAKYRKMSTRVFQSRAGAIAIAKELGHDVDDKTESPRDLLIRKAKLYRERLKQNGG